MKSEKSQFFGWTLIILLASVTALAPLGIDMYLPAFPAVANDMGVSSGQVQQTLSIFLIGLALGQAGYGPLLDRFGRRLPLLVGMAVFIAGSVLVALAPTFEWLMAARFIQALGAAAGLVVPRAIVADVCDLPTAARIFSVLMQVMTVAPVVAPLIGGYLLIYSDWRMVFWVLALFTVAITLWGMAIVPETLERKQRVPLLVGNIIGAYRRQSKNRVFMAYVLASGFVMSSLFLYISASPFVFIDLFKLTPLNFSYVFALNAVGLIVAGQLSIWLLNRIPAQNILKAGLIVHTLASVVLFVIIHFDVVHFWVYLLLLGVSIWSLGLILGNVTALIMAQAGPQAGVASALMGMIQYLIAAAMGFMVSFATPTLALLPLALSLCGALACICCWIASNQRSSKLDRQTK